MAKAARVVCPVCGYENRPRAVQCNLCREVLPKADEAGAGGFSVATASYPAARVDALSAIAQEPTAPAPGREIKIPPAMRISFYQAQTDNKRNSTAMIAGMVTLLTALGMVIGATYGDAFIGALGAFAAASGVGAYTWFAGAGTILSMSGAKQVTHDVHPQLFNVVEEMKIASGLPMPKVYIIESDAPNAFATGRDPEHSAVAVTTGLLAKLNRDELQGVIAHEMSHIRNYDIRFAMIAAIMVGSIALISDAFLRSRRSGRGGHPIMIVVALLLAALAPLSATILQMAISRQREFLADASAAALTRNPDGLANALYKITHDDKPLDTANRATQHLYIINPLKSFSMKSTNLFSTHPPTEARLRALGQMGADISSLL